MRQWTGSWLGQIMACCLFGTKPLYKPMLGYCQLDPKEQTSVKFESKYKTFHDNVIKWEHFLHYWPFVWGIHRSPVNSPLKSQWCGALLFSLICAWINNRWVNNREAGELRHRRAHYDIIVMFVELPWKWMHIISYIICRWNIRQCFDEFHKAHNKFRPETNG